MVIEKHAERYNGKTDDKNFLKIEPEDFPSIKDVIDLMPDNYSMIDPETIKKSQHVRTAYHELGHALITKLLTDDKLARITISPEGNGALGYIRHSKAGYENSTKQQFKDRICISMAGIAAEEVFLGEYASGGTSDLEKATQTAKFMITKAGMSENGFAYFPEEDEKEIKKEVNSILTDEFNRAKEFITNYKDSLEKAKNVLLKKETLSEEEFMKIVSDIFTESVNIS
jgi:cell division protease FtsH